MTNFYTATLHDGEESFEDFALRCTRAFLVQMREAPNDAPIPEKFEPDSYYVDRVKDAEAALESAKKLTRQEAFDQRMAVYNEALRLHEQFVADAAARRPRYEAMLEKAKAWEAPTEEHTRFREFMIEQLEEGIEYDCSTRGLSTELTPPDPATDYRAAVVQDAINELAYAREKEQTAIARAAEASSWIARVRTALGVEA